MPIDWTEASWAAFLQCLDREDGMSSTKIQEYLLATFRMRISKSQLCEEIKRANGDRASYLPCILRTRAAHPTAPPSFPGNMGSPSNDTTDMIPPVYIDGRTGAIAVANRRQTTAVQHTGQDESHHFRQYLGPAMQEPSMSRQTSMQSGRQHSATVMSPAEGLAAIDPALDPALASSPGRSFSTVSGEAMLRAGSRQSQDNMERTMYSSAAAAAAVSASHINYTLMFSNFDVLVARENINKPDDTGRPALHVAVIEARRAFVEWLVAAGADTTVLNSTGQNLLQVVSDACVTASQLQRNAILSCYQYVCDNSASRPDELVQDPFSGIGQQMFGLTGGDPFLSTLPEDEQMLAHDAVPEMPNQDSDWFSVPSYPPSF